jgi:photosystem I reaction center subunit VIII
MIIPNLPYFFVPLVGLLLPTITIVLFHLYIQNDDIF